MVDIGGVHVGMDGVGWSENFKQDQAITPVKTPPAWASIFDSLDQATPTFATESTGNIKEDDNKKILTFNGLEIDYSNPNSLQKPKVGTVTTKDNKTGNEIKFNYIEGNYLKIKNIDENNDKKQTFIKGYENKYSETEKNFGINVVFIDGKLNSAEHAESYIAKGKFNTYNTNEEHPIIKENGEYFGLNPEMYDETDRTKFDGLVAEENTFKNKEIYDTRKGINKD